MIATRRPHILHKSTYLLFQTLILQFFFNPLEKPQVVIVPTLRFDIGCGSSPKSVNSILIQEQTRENKGLNEVLPWKDGENVTFDNDDGLTLSEFSFQKAISPGYFHR